MNRIEKMMKEMCPGGVERVKLGEVCEFTRGNTITAKDAIEGEVPVIAGGQNPSYYHNSSNRIGETITVAGSGAYAGFVAYWNIPIWVSDAFTVDVSDKLLIKYVYFFLKHNQQKIFATQKGAGVPHVHGKDIANFEIPFPPLSAQQEIVNILDNFTALQQNLEDELKLRQKQYEYYREKLLTFQEGECEWKKLEAIVDKNCSISYGIVQPGEDIEDGIPVVRPVDMVDTITHNVNLKCTTKEISNSYKKTLLEGGEILVCVRGTTGIVSIAGDDLDGCNVTRGITPLKIDKDIDSKYVYFVFCSNAIQDAIEANTNGAGLRQINMKDLRNIELPIPSKSKQQQIVNTLSHFELLISNLRHELSLRQKQYEYYREKLLTF